MPEPALHERLRFDTARGQVVDATRRYLLLRADVLMGLFDALPQPDREAALHAFGRSVALHGSDSVRAYAATAGNDGLLEVVESAAASLGWGVWKIERRSSDGGGAELHLNVENSPFASATTRSSAPVCHAIAGMLEGVATALWRHPARARETRCGCGHGGACDFIAVPDRAPLEFGVEMWVPDA